MTTSLHSLDDGNGEGIGNTLGVGSTVVEGAITKKSIKHTSTALYVISLTLTWRTWNYRLTKVIMGQGDTK